MDLSFIVVIAVSAILTSLLMLYSEVTRRRRSTFRLAFGVSYLIGLSIMQPWPVTTAEDAGMSMMMPIFMALWVAIGCIIGAIPTAVTVSVGRWITRLLRRRS